MPLIALILFVIAAVVFGVAAFAVAARVNLVSLGLCVFVVAVICQFLVHGPLVG